MYTSKKSPFWEKGFFLHFTPDNQQISLACGQAPSVNEERELIQSHNSIHQHNKRTCSSTPSKRRLRALLTSGSGLGATRQDLAGALLHAHLALHLLHLLLLAEGQRPWDAEQEGAGADDPEGLAAEAEARGGPVVGRGGGGGEALAVGRGHDVSERGEAVREGLFVGVVGDVACFGF